MVPGAIGIVRLSGPKAVEIAQKLATDPKKRGLFGKDPQKEINKAYGDVMKKIATKIKEIEI